MSQLGFDDLLAQTEADNEARALLLKFPNLPTTWEAAIPHYRSLLERCNAAFLAADIDEIQRIYEEADALAEYLHGGTCGVKAQDGAATRLANETRAPVGTMPIWGQDGEFIVEVHGIKIRLETEGVFGIATSYVLLPTFSAHAVDYDKPFISETGYRSFIGYGGLIEEGVTLQEFARGLMERYIAKELKGRLVKINKERYFRAEPSEYVQVSA